MSGICDACKRTTCEYRADDIAVCGLPKTETNWERLFGTPERAAKTLESLDEMSCRYCLIRDHCGDSSHMRFDTLESCLLFRSDDALLEWLRGASDGE